MWFPLSLSMLSLSLLGPSMSRSNRQTEKLRRSDCEDGAVTSLEGRSTSRSSPPESVRERPPLNYEWRGTPSHTAQKRCLQCTLALRLASLDTFLFVAQVVNLWFQPTRPPNVARPADLTNPALSTLTPTKAEEGGGSVLRGTFLPQRSVCPSPPPTTRDPKRF